MAAHRKEKGLVDGGPAAASAYGKPIVAADGRTEVRMSNRCMVRYDTEGIRQDISAACTPAQLKAADEAEVRFRLGRLNQQGQGN